MSTIEFEEFYPAKGDLKHVLHTKDGYVAVGSTQEAQMATGRVNAAYCTWLHLQGTIKDLRQNLQTGNRLLHQEKGLVERLQKELKEYRRGGKP